MKRLAPGLPAWLSLAALLAVTGAAAAAPAQMGKVARAQALDTQTRFDINNIEMFVTNFGIFANDQAGEGQPAGFFYPKGTDKTAVYSAGLWFASKVNGQPHVSTAEFGSEFIPGFIYQDSLWCDVGNDSLRTLKMSRADTTGGDYLVYRRYAADHRIKVDPLVGDQTLWSIFHDADPEMHTNMVGASPPQYVEIQQTTFGFDRQGPLGNMVFIKWKIINKGADTLRDCYASFWSDPDLGGMTDDLVGCDTDRSLGFVYNANNNDEIYGNAPPSVGYRFFQGPIVPGAPTDSALVNGRWRHGYRNLPMTSFNKYVNGTDPRSAVQSYNYIQGLDADGGALTDPVTGRVTTFVHPGDPVARSGWLDPQPADKRLQLSSGPFVMAPKDTQEVVVGIIVGQGKDRLQSITVMKLYADQALDAFKENFILASPPPRPTFYASPGDQQIDLYWGQEAVGNVSETPRRRFVFEGYNLYQGESVAGPWHKLATWDIADSVGIIYEDAFDANAGGLQRIVAQLGTNNGLVYHVRLTQDEIRGGKLQNGSPYYYALCAYSYDERNMVRFSLGPQTGWLTQNLENSPIGVTVSPMSSSAVLRLTAEHTGTSDGTVDVVVLDPSKTVPGRYGVTIRTDPNDPAALVYDLLRTNPDTLLVQGDPVRSDPEFYAFPVRDGMMVRVMGPQPGPRRTTEDAPMIDVIRSDGGEQVPADVRGGPGGAVWHHLDPSGKWTISAGGLDGGEVQLSRDGADWAAMDARDLLVKFDNDPNNLGWWLYDSGDSTGWAPIPFGIYQRNVVTGVETRMVPMLFSGDADTGSVAVFDYCPGGEIDPFSGWPATDRIYAVTFSGDWSALVADVGIDHSLEDAVMLDELYNVAPELFARMMFASETRTLPSTGTVIQISTNKPMTTTDTFAFNIYPPGCAPGTVVGYDLNAIRAVPNPYLNQSAYELNQFSRVLKFTHLPNRPTTIRIFNLAGELVRSMEKDDPNAAEMVWDLLNQSRIPVASGIYLYHVDVKGVGTHTGKLAVFVEKERLNRF
jgi:hypothetical protein